MKLRTMILVSALVSTVALAVNPPPSLMNYQGVLRSPAGAPLSGSFDMVFRLYDAPAAGNELIVDEHLAAGTGGVVVTNGLFSTAIGGGTVTDGGGVGTFASLGDVFRRSKTVYLEITVGGEALLPRIRVASSAYALDDATVDPPCASAGVRFSDCGNGTLTDNVTGLVWLKTVDCSAHFGASQTYAQAFQTVANLADGLCGLTDKSKPGDWRVPSKDELWALISRATDNGCFSPRLPNANGLNCCVPGAADCPFTSIDTGIPYWTSTGVLADPANGYVISLSNGALSNFPKGLGYQVWPVRDPQ